MLLPIGKKVLLNYLNFSSGEILHSRISTCPGFLLEEDELSFFIVD